MGPFPDVPTAALLDEIARTELPASADLALLFYAAATALVVGTWLLGRLADTIVRASKLAGQPG